MKPITRIYRFSKRFLWRCMLFILAMVLGSYMGLFVISFQAEEKKSEKK